MIWNLSAECISGVIVTIILVYAYRGSKVPTLKNRVFEVCLLVTFGSILCNILSTVMLQFHTAIPPVLTELVTTIYFLCTPMMGLTYFWYTSATACEGQRWLRPMLLATSAPYLVYVLAVVFNHWTQDLFYIDAVAGYVRGTRIGLTYTVFYFYCLACIVLSIFRWNKTDRVIRVILFSFPVIALLVVLVQAAFPMYILTGSAATCALLIIYLYIQNKRISMDGLTGLATRQEFLGMLALRQQQSEAFCIIVLSINNFKLINDKFGVVTGDLFLKHISAFLQDYTRGSEVYRYGGDQFAVYLPKRQVCHANELADGIAKRMQSPWSVGEYSYILSAAIGVVECPTTAQSMDEVVGAIEAVVEEAKRRKLTVPYHCTPQTLDGIRRKKRIIELLREHLKNDSFMVYYQPIWSLEENRFQLAEALLRMPEDPVLGYVSPGEFIPLAEDTGLIIDITYQTLDKVCRFIRRLMDENVELDAVATNFSVIQFLQEGLAERVEDIVERNRVPYSKVKIEITESTLITNTENIIEFMERLCEKGVRFGLDDFGTGNSNVATVLKVPFDTIKMDKSIVWLVMDDPQAAHFLRSLALGFKAMGRRIVAEGVETRAQRDCVQSCGCDYIQGFLYARPVPPEQAMQAILAGAPKETLGEGTPKGTLAQGKA